MCLTGACIPLGLCGLSLFSLADALTETKCQLRCSPLRRMQMPRAQGPQEANNQVWKTSYIVANILIKLLRATSCDREYGGDQRRKCCDISEDTGKNREVDLHRVTFIPTQGYYSYHRVGLCIIIIIIFLSFVFFLGLHPRHMKVPRLGV